MEENKRFEVIGGRRVCGKTTQLIKRAHEEQLYILCSNKHMARIIFKQSQEMELNIPYPITVEELPLKSNFIDRILIDEVEMVLRQLIGVSIAAMSTSYKLNEFESLRNEYKKQTEEKESTPLIQIELEDENSIPKVFYEGEEITGKAQITFDWITKKNRGLGGMKFNIEHADEKGIVHTKGRRRGDFR